MNFNLMSLFKKDQKGELSVVGGLIVGIVMAIIALVIYSILTSSIAPTTITSLSNTTAISGYGTWSTGTQNIWTSIPTVTVLAYFLIPILVVVVLAGALGKY